MPDLGSPSLHSKGLNWDNIQSALFAPEPAAAGEPKLGGPGSKPPTSASQWLGAERQTSASSTGMSFPPDLLAVGDSHWGDTKKDGGSSSSWVRKKSAGQLEVGSPRSGQQSSFLARTVLASKPRDISHSGPNAAPVSYSRFEKWNLGGSASDRGNRRERLNSGSGNESPSHDKYDHFKPGSSLEQKTSNSLERKSERWDRWSTSEGNWRSKGAQSGSVANLSGASAADGKREPVQPYGRGRGFSAGRGRPLYVQGDKTVGLGIPVLGSRNKSLSEYEVDRPSTRNYNRRFMYGVLHGLERLKKPVPAPEGAILEELADETYAKDPDGTADTEEEVPEWSDAPLPKPGQGSFNNSSFELNPDELWKDVSIASGSSLQRKSLLQGLLEPDPGAGSMQTTEGTQAAPATPAMMEPAPHQQPPPPPKPAAAVPQVQDASSASSVPPGHATEPNVTEQWLYRDPKGMVQGPFHTKQMLEWYGAKFFPLDLPVSSFLHPHSFQPLSFWLMKWGINIEPVPPPPHMQGVASMGFAKAEQPSTFFEQAVDGQGLDRMRQGGANAMQQQQQQQQQGGFILQQQEMPPHPSMAQHSSMGGQGIQMVNTMNVQMNVNQTMQPQFSQHMQAPLQTPVGGMLNYGGVGTNQQMPPQVGAMDMMNQSAGCGPGAQEQPNPMVLNQLIGSTNGQWQQAIGMPKMPGNVHSLAEAGQYGQQAAGYGASMQAPQNQKDLIPPPPPPTAPMPAMPIGVQTLEQIEAQMGPSHANNAMAEQLGEVTSMLNISHLNSEAADSLPEDGVDGSMPQEAQAPPPPPPQYWGESEQQAEGGMSMADIMNEEKKEAQRIEAARAKAARTVVRIQKPPTQPQPQQQQQPIIPEKKFEGWNAHESADTTQSLAEILEEEKRIAATKSARDARQSAAAYGGSWAAKLGGNYANMQDPEEAPEYMVERKRKQTKPVQVKPAASPPKATEVRRVEGKTLSMIQAEEMERKRLAMMSDSAGGAFAPGSQDDDMFWEMPAQSQAPPRSNHGSDLGVGNPWNRAADTLQPARGRGNSNSHDFPTLGGMSGSRGPSAKSGGMDKLGRAPHSQGNAQALANALHLSNDFKAWCQSQMVMLNGSDDLTLIEFLMSLSSESEIKEYLVVYLGNNKKVTKFSEDFLLRKQEEEALHNNGANTGGWETAKQSGSNASKKKGKKKGKKLDASILGFSSSLNYGNLEQGVGD